MNFHELHDILNYLNLNESVEMNQAPEKNVTKMIQNLTR